MKYYGVNELRRMFLEFFESKDHLRLNSFSLVPQNDKSLLLINSGMAPMMIIGSVPLYNIMAVVVLSFFGQDKKAVDKGT